MAANQSSKQFTECMVKTVNLNVFKQLMHALVYGMLPTSFVWQKRTSLTNNGIRFTNIS